jgi:hypothetical protein
MSVEMRKLSPEPNAMFCRRLAEVAFPILLEEQKHDKDAQPGKVCVHHKHVDEIGLREELLSNPRLQQRLSVKSYYTPSKWLLEQEMEARNTWCAGRPGEVAVAALPNAKHAGKHGSKTLSREGDKGDVFRVVAKEENRLVGVCSSGGGIRSATFNLGVLQAFAQLGLLPHIDYLSSVSGGGYIHEFLAGWILREPGGRDSVIKQLIPQAEPGCLPRSPEPIKWLVRYASYLTPARGLFTADTWTMVAIWLRNTILNQVPILTGLAAVFFVVHLLALTPIRDLASTFDFAAEDRFGFLMGLIGVGVGVIAVLSLIALGRNLLLQTAISRDELKASRLTPLREKGLAANLLTNRLVQLWIIVPWLAASVWLSFWSQFQFVRHPWLQWIPPAVACGMVLALVFLVIYAGGAFEAFLALEPDATPLRKTWARTLIFLAGVLAAAVACAFGYGFVQGSWYISVYSSYLAGPMGSVDVIDPWRIELVLLPGALLSVPYIAIELTLGLLGRDYSETRREWMARMRAWSLLYALTWSGVVGVVLLGPYAVYWLLGKSLPWIYSAIATFFVAHGATIFAGWSGKADGKPTDKGFLGLKPLDLVAVVASPIAILGLLIALSYGVSVAVDALTGVLTAQNATWEQFALADLICAAGTAAVAVLFGWRIDINEFSMQSFFRNRVTRCYLGATLRDRQPDPFTGFDDRTKVTKKNIREQTIPPRVVDLLPEKFNRHEHRDGEYHGPFPIFCTTLNLTTGEDLATQERKGASFAFTPLYSGYSVSWTEGKSGKVSFNGYVPTKDYAYRQGGIHLDTAVAVSGAALNPNMGYNSNPALAFLMTFFNVRLGWWITNPRMKHRWRAKRNRPTPKFPGLWLLQELFGSVNDASRYVNLSDGGHFENMGLYELVRRRCSYIIVCDAEGDATMKFEGMGTAIAKCRSDFGAEIDLDLRPLQLDEKSGYSSAHCVVGTIRYPPPPPPVEGEEEAKVAPSARECDCMGDAGKDPYTGVIVYMKSSLVGDEPADLLAYKLRHDVFPHDMTGNQWFTETQFESYRRLGHHIAMTAIQPALSPERDQVNHRSEIKDLFRRMYAIWYPRTPEMEKHLADHLRQYESILSELRAHQELAGLEARLNDERGLDECELVEWNAPVSPAGSHDYAMQFANSLLDFMYTVYTNLQLAFPDNQTSPHADWWICLFRRWCRVTLVQKAWLQHVPMYPVEFRLFARRELKLIARRPFVE